MAGSPIEKNTTRIRNQFGLKIIVVYYPSINNFIYDMKINNFQKNNKAKGTFWTTFEYVLNSDG
jgi:hypothetical protein